jgi:class 3 adenylate cyclase
MSIKAQELLANPLSRVGCEVARNRHYDGANVQRQRLLSVAAVIGAIVTAGFGVMQLLESGGFGYIGFVNLGTAALFVVTPLLYRFGELLAPLAFLTVAYLSGTFLCWHLGTGTGVQFYFVIAAAAAVMVVGIEHIRIAIAAAAIGVSLVIALQFTVPQDTGAEPPWFITHVWGDAVNVASRMESTAAVGRIQVPQPVYQRLSNRFVLEERGDVDVKGKGVMHTWYLVGRNDQCELGDNDYAKNVSRG